MDRSLQPLYASVGRRLLRYALADDGRVHEVDSLDMPCTVQYACLDAARSLLYVACSNGGVGNPGDFHRLVHVELSGQLRQRGVPVALPYRPIHLSMHPRSDRLMVAYNAPAALTVHELDAAGDITKSIGPFERSDGIGWFPHQVLSMPQGRDALLVCRGDDAVGEHRENPGSLQVLDIDDGSVRLSQRIAPGGGYGFGPRNGAFHPSRPWLYVVLERQNALAMFRIEAGKIAREPAFTRSLLERLDELRRPQLGGAIEIHPSGRFAFVVNRAHAQIRHAGRLIQAGGENSIASFALDLHSGEPVLQQFAPLAGLHARCMALAHGGSVLVAAVRQASARLVGQRVMDCPAGFTTFAVKPDGRLAPLHHHPVEVGDAQLFWAGVS